MYLTKSGDTFDKIAFDQWGNEKLSAVLIESNIEYADILIFGSGIELVIPEIDSTPTSNLPPWKRGED